MLRRSFSLITPQASKRATTQLVAVRCAISATSAVLQQKFQWHSTRSSSSSSVVAENGSNVGGQEGGEESAQSITAKACPFSGKSSAPAESCPLETPKRTDLYSVANQLGKSKLSAFVTSTATAGYVLCGGTSVVTATLVTLGTYLQSLSANTANQCIEIEHDRKMKRTMFRPLVTGVITRPAAMALCAAELAIGTGMLAYSVPAAATATSSSSSLLLASSVFPAAVASTPVGQAVALLGVVNWVLYVCMYTPLKRVSATNTWFGAIVGAIPPLMGGVAALTTCSASAPAVASLFASAAGATLTPSTLASLLLVPQLAPAYLLAVIMFAWQIPHFMSLSFHCRRDYESAGYKMLAFSNPTRAAGYAVLLSSVMAVFCVPCVHWFMPVEPWYYVLATAANGTMIFKSVRFFIDPKKYCRSCFVFSYIFLSLMLALLCLNHMQPVHRIQTLLFANDFCESKLKLTTEEPEQE